MKASIVVLIFVTMLLLTQSAYHLYRGRQLQSPSRVRRRIKTVFHEQGDDGTAASPFLKSRALSDIPQLNRLLVRMKAFKTLEEFLIQTNSSWTVGRLLLTTAFLAVAAWCVAEIALHRGLVTDLVAAVLTAGVPFLILSNRKWQRERAFERQLPDVLDLMSRSMRAGHSLTGAIRFAGEECSEPAGPEIARVFDEVNFGVDVATALKNLSQRVACYDLRFLVAAITIQRETGGNLSELLDQLAHLMRERFKLQGQTRALTAQGRLSGWILAVLPAAMGCILMVIQPDYLLTLVKDPAGHLIIGVTVGLQIVGMLIIQKIVNIEAL